MSVTLPLGRFIVVCPRNPAAHTPRPDLAAQPPTSFLGLQHLHLHPRGLRGAGAGVGGSSASGLPCSQQGPALGVPASRGVACTYPPCSSLSVVPLNVPLLFMLVHILGQHDGEAWGRIVFTAPRSKPRLLGGCKHQVVSLIEIGPESCVLTSCVGSVSSLRVSFRWSFHSEGHGRVMQWRKQTVRDKSGGIVWYRPVPRVARPAVLWPGSRSKCCFLLLNLVMTSHFSKPESCQS